MADRAPHDQNLVSGLLAASNIDGITPVALYADPTTHALVTSGGGTGGGGTQYAELITTAPATGTVALGRYKLAPPTLTDGQLYGLQLDSSGNLKVTGTFSANPPSSVISSVNSTATNLAGGVAFTGTGEDVSNYAAIQIAIFSSHVSATDGLSLQQSSDNSNWDITDVYTIPATTGKVFSVQPAAKYFRLVYTNGATLTTSLRIQVVYHYSAPNPSSQRTADAYTNETDLTQQWSFNSLYNGTTWDRMRGDTTNGLDVDVTRMAALVAGSAIIGKVGIDQTTPGTTNLVALAANQSVNVTQFSGTTAVNGSGNATGALRVELPTNGTGVVGLNTGTNSIGKISDITTSIVPGTGSTNLGKAEDAVHTTGDTGVAILAVRDDTLNSTSGTEGDYEMFHTTAEGALWVTQAPSITNGWATFNATSGDGSTALTATAQQVKATTGTVGGWYVYNPNATATYVNFYNVASASVTVGTTNQQMVICIPPTSAANVEFGNGITFATAISISATTTGGGNTAPATALECNIFFK
jgi:hypothetical protein